MKMRKPNLRLKGLRVTHGIHQKDISELLGIGETTYNRKENGFNEFTENEIFLICNYFKVDPKDIFFNDIVTKTTTKG
ncbi:helix-turn-helix transcriptional regulator [Tissierella praeacuta]|uniref:helix-turn-helix transcriptional regulator n=1 Tax=Tissierella praeacuta TaxID=43131 RepID=UPI0028A7A1FD|nr:helix-turn-helix transcriptional regulator [Tissierella praeacuta]